MLRLLALLSLLALAGGAHAAPPRRPALHWSRSENASACIDPHALALRVTTLTGPVLVDATEADVSIEGHVARDPQGVYVARITATGRDGVSRGARTLRQKDDCRALDQALAFVIALLIDPDLVLEQLPQELVTLGAEGETSQTRLLRELAAEPPRSPAPASSDAPTARPAPVPQPSAAADPPAPAPRPTVYQLHFGATIASRELPRATAGLYLALGIAPLRWLGLDLALRAGFMPGPVELEAGREINAQRFSGAVLACPRYPWEGMYIELCVGPQVALIRAKGKGFASDDVARRAAFAAQVAASFSALLVRDWWLRLRGQVELLLNDPSFRYSADDPEPYAFRIERLAYGADLGVAYQF